MNKLHEALKRYFDTFNSDIISGLNEYIVKHFPNHPCKDIESLMAHYSDKHINDIDVEQLIENINYTAESCEHSISELGEIYDLVDAMI